MPIAKLCYMVVNKINVHIMPQEMKVVATNLIPIFLSEKRTKLHMYVYHLVFSFSQILFEDMITFNKTYCYNVKPPVSTSYKEIANLFVIGIHVHIVLLIVVCDFVRN